MAAAPNVNLPRVPLCLIGVATDASLNATDRPVEGHVHFKQRNEMPTKVPGNLEVMSKTVCAHCGDSIDAGDYRVAVTAVEMHPLGSKQSSSRGPAKPGLTAFCGVCVAKISSFPLPNPWKAIVDQPHTSGVNKPDLDASSTTSCSPGKASPESAGEASQRAHILKFLNDPRSMAMRSDMRDVARMWAEGASLNEVARKLGKDQSTISRIIQGARKMSYALG